MNILHITAHMGDGAGKAIGGLAIYGQRFQEDTHWILLLDAPKKTNHVDRCRDAGIEILTGSEAEAGIKWADIVVLSWWGSPSMDKFLTEYPEIPCRVVLWTHKNGFYDPPLPQSLVDSCDQLLVTSPVTFENPAWRGGVLVSGYGDFDPADVPQKKDYTLAGNSLVIGYVGMPSYKRFPKNICDYIHRVLERVPHALFLFAGECSPGFRADLDSSGLTGCVKLLGWREDVLDLLSSFDVFGYLTRPDTSATTENSVLEAMAAALPVVMSRDPIGSYVLGRDGGLLAASPEEYAEQIERLSCSEDLRRTLGQAARKRILSVCSVVENYSRFQQACGQAVQRQKYIHQFGGYDRYGCCCCAEL